jgi:hypothetical protein
LSALSRLIGVPKTERRQNVLRALETSLGSYATCGDVLVRLAEKIRDAPADDDLVTHQISMVVTERTAEANLEVAKTADEMATSLLHVIA